MLRVSLQKARVTGTTTVTRASRQWLVQVPAVRRSFADKPSIQDPKPIVLPGSRSEATDEPIPQGPIITINSENPLTSAGSNIPTIPADNVPLTPPPVPASTIQTARETVASTTPPPPPSEPEKIERWIPDKPPVVVKKRRGFFSRFLTTLVLLGVVGFAGGVYYSRINDNFHDFFTEYIPFGEEAVLYLEEREFRKRFPAQNRPRVRDTGDKVTIPRSSGVSSRISQEETKISNALAKNTVKPDEAQKNPSATTTKDKAAAVEKAKAQADAPAKSPKPAGKEPEPSPASIAKPAAAPTPAPAPAPAPASSPAPAPAAAPAPVKKESVASPKSNAMAPAAATAAVPVVERMPEVDEPSRFPAEISRIDPINVNGAQEPIVQDVVKILNDIITVINADNANPRYSSTIQNAKSKVQQVASQVNALKDAAAKDAENKIKAAHEDFDRGAKELIRRLENEMHSQEAQWKEDYESERQKIQNSYEERLKLEVERARQLNEQKLQNELLEQALEMKKHFVAEVKERVESERNARLGKLSDLTATVGELEKLTTGWSSVVDENLRTQHLHVAVEAVRSSLENATTPKPFIRELAALKEIAQDSPLVNAAIASINPTAYQRGVPSSAQLIDRFRRVAQEVRKASLLPEDAGIASHATSYVLSKLMFKKKGLAEGSDVESILTRTETFLEEGDLDGAAREMNGLRGWAKTLSKDWLGECRRVLEVKQALDVIATEARLQSLRVQ